VMEGNARGGLKENVILSQQLSGNVSERGVRLEKTQHRWAMEPPPYLRRKTNRKNPQRTKKDGFLPWGRGPLAKPAYLNVCS